MDDLHERNEELLDELVGRMRRAELALNRHGFKDDGNEWHAPPVWATMVELRCALATAEKMIAQLAEERDTLRAQVELLNFEVLQ